MQALVQALGCIELVTSAFAVISSLQVLMNGFMQPLPGTSRAWWAAFILNPQYYLFQAVASGLLSRVNTTIVEPSGASITVGDYVTRLYGMPGSTFPGAHGSQGMLVALGGAFASVSLTCARCKRAAM